MTKPKLLIPSVNARALPEIIRENAVIVVHVWAEWNPYDYQMDAWLCSFQPEFPDQRFFSLDTGPESEWEFLHQHHIMTLPTLLCFINGGWHETYIGLRSEAELKAKLRAWSTEQAA